jgi:hypothetical protein
MGSKERKPRPTLTGRFVRGRRLDRKPLRARLLLVAFLVA